MINPKKFISKHITVELLKTKQERKTQKRQRERETQMANE